MPQVKTTIVPAAIGLLGCASMALAQPAPNVIYIMLDDLGPGEYSVYDNFNGLGTESKIDTPNINSLASNGMRFNNAHAATTLCAPTRAVVMAGAPTWQTNTRWGFGSASLRSGQQSVGDIMQAGGYRTGLMGKGHIGGDIYEIGSNNSTSKSLSNLSNMDFDRPLKDGMKEHGYDYTFNLIGGIQAPTYFYWEDDLATDTDADGNSTRITNANKNSMIQQWNAFYDDGVTEIWEGASGIGSVNWNTRDVPQAMLNKAVDFMDDTVTNHSTEPFFLHYNSVAGHWPYVAPTDIAVDINGDGDTLDPGEFHDIDGYNGTGPAPDDLGTESMQMVSVSDAEVGVILSYLEQTDDPRNPGHKLVDNTMIIYTSDNGGIGPDYVMQHGPLDQDEWDVYEHDSTSGLEGNKAWYTEGGHRVPFFVQWPGMIEAGAVRDQQISNIDLMGTLAGLTGQSLTDQGEGSFNMMPVFLGDRDDTDPVRPNLVVEDVGGASDGNITRKLYYEGTWKMTLGASSTTNPTIYGFYDLSIDPAETNDLTNDPTYASLRDDMYQRYLTERNAVRMAPAFIGANDTMVPAAFTGYTDVVAEGELEGAGQINGTLEANNGSLIEIVDTTPGAVTVEYSMFPAQDIRLDDDGLNYNLGSRLAAGRDGDLGLQRSAIEFDLTSLNLPVGSTVTDVEMVMTVGFSWGPGYSSSPTLEFYPLTSDFDETTATWNFPWTTPGGDYDENTLLGTITGFNPDTVGGGDELILDDPAFIADVLANLSNPNYHIYMKYDDASEAIMESTAVWVNANENGSPATQLVFTVDVPTAVTEQTLVVDGDYIQRPGAELMLTLDGTGTKGDAHGLLDIAGTMDIKGGTLTINLGAGFNPAGGDTFDIFDFSTAVGAFDLFSLPALDPGLTWDTTMLLVDGTLSVFQGAALVGDLNLDGNIDGLDIDGFVLALTDLSAYAISVGLSEVDATVIADINNDGNVDGLDIDGFVALLTGSEPMDGPRAGVVPEPTSLALLAIGGLAVSRRRTIKRS